MTTNTLELEKPYVSNIETSKATKSQQKKNKFGQYFTPEMVAEFMINICNIDHESKILEPSCGEGIFLKLLSEKGYKRLSAFEIDKSLSNDFDFVRYESFVSARIEEKFDLVIGNPPYIRWSNLEPELKKELGNNILWNTYFNSLCDYLYIFILKSIELLKDGGQLVFICPEYWMNTTHSITLRNYMVENGYFEEIYHFNETPIFDKVAVSLIIFKYIKGKSNTKKNISVSKYYLNKKLTNNIIESLKSKSKHPDIDFINVSQFEKNERWILVEDKKKNELFSFENACIKQKSNTLFKISDDKEYKTIGDFCDIGNGLVSGLDKAFQVHNINLNDNEKNEIIKVIKAKNLEPYYYNEITDYIFINSKITEEELKERYPNFYSQLINYKEDLDSRYQYNKIFNFWEWVFPRSLNLFSRNEQRIFVPCKERISNKDYFRFSLIPEGIFPTQDVTAIFKKSGVKEDIEYIVSFLNNKRVYDWLTINGIIKGNIVEFSEKPISSIPFRAIDWNNSDEVEIHNLISQETKKYITTKNANHIAKINQLFNQLF